MKATLAAAVVILALGNARAADIRVRVTNEEGRPVSDAVVVAVPESGVGAPRSGTDPIEQIDYEFVPRVKVVRVGTPVSFPNRDGVRHHVYSFSPAKRFELPLYAGTPAQPVVFDKPGVVTLGCNIHDWMVGYVYVSDSPYFATTGVEGTAVLSGVPSGRYAVRVWHALAPGAETTRRQADVAASGASLEWRLALKPEVRVRRAPTAGRSGRY